MCVGSLWSEVALLYCGVTQGGGGIHSEPGASNQSIGCSCRVDTAMADVIVRIEYRARVAMLIIDSISVLSPLSHHQSCCSAGVDTP